MNNLVESLRYFALPLAGETRKPPNADLLSAAADEIERLRNECDYLKVRVGTYYAGNPEGGIVRRLEEEIKRLCHELADAHGVAQACEIRAEKAEAGVERLRELLRDVDDGLDDYWVITKDGVSWIRRRSEALGE